MSIPRRDHSSLHSRRATQGDPVEAHASSATTLRRLEGLRAPRCSQLRLRPLIDSRCAISLESLEKPTERHDVARHKDPCFSKLEPRSKAAPQAQGPFMRRPPRAMLATRGRREAGLEGSHGEGRGTKGRDTRGHPPRPGERDNPTRCPGSSCSPALRCRIRLPIPGAARQLCEANGVQPRSRLRRPTAR